ncbi:DUF3619 family protein [Candidatus Aalborgicola defluviihabitans]|jgi:hypothetical protein|uniref:DUF3619 family protein n=1 Tax=Candidatus Aalborgicola defluviihabitans TaxID=3386187 RepID=UPI001D979D1B|nr:DUF3619 family protein [Burkholderiales bacterium]MBK6567421.1 DUF3619 family protein [Burkholderiales bacterium]MBK7282535.1 DUF3619 family protein [Burkholderiales bacterium]MBK7314276.1 DUF3619 family protein [Burkholderiales bacterium]MBL0244775.1 DUF3619 family protein [Rhodoferax sp.]
MKTLDLHQIDNYQDRFGRNVAARLSDTSQGISPDISERLKAARMLALSKRKVVKLQTASNINTNGSAATLNSGDADNGLWNRLGSIIPLLALVAGLLAIAVIQEQRVTKEIADVDVELLADDLPPAAFTDPGFVRYLSTNRRD